MKLELTRNRQKKRFFEKLFPSPRKLDFNFGNFELLTYIWRIFKVWILKLSYFLYFPSFFDDLFFILIDFGVRKNIVTKIFRITYQNNVYDHFQYVQLFYQKFKGSKVKIQFSRRRKKLLKNLFSSWVLVSYKKGIRSKEFIVIFIFLNF